ncbi:HIT family protein [Metasolibacillus sp. FSL H7-0170]|uniref:HIT family protein n=1 Tax=Metasolibacillus sp. FSL H7-0170 TaxID=2921431 RepID=UPI003158E242
MNCLGCHLANKKAPVYVIFENEHVCCILDCAPYNEGHVLILPKKHVCYFDELNRNMAAAVMEATQLISKTIKTLFQPDGITVCQNGGAFDELTHFHMHVVPRYEGQHFADFFREGEEVHVDEQKLVKTQTHMVNMIKSLEKTI